MDAGDPGGDVGRLSRRSPSVGIGGLKSDPRTARTTVKFIDSPTLLIPNPIGAPCLGISLL